MLQIEDHEIEQRLETLGAHSPRAKVGLVRQMLLQASERLLSARSSVVAELQRVRDEPLEELNEDLWLEIFAGPPRAEDLDELLGLAVPPEESGRTLREFLAADDIERLRN